MAVGKLTYLRRRYISPQWSVLAREANSIYGIILNTYWLRSTAERRAHALNTQLPGESMNLYFKPQKRACF